IILVQGGLDQGRDALGLGAVGLGRVLGWHQAALQVLADLRPDLATGLNRALVAQGLDVQPGLGLLGTVTARAMARQEWGDDPLAPVSILRVEPAYVRLQGSLSGNPPRRGWTKTSPGHGDGQEPNMQTHPCLAVKSRYPIGGG